VINAHQLGWTLVHSVWEIAAISIVLFVANLCLRGANAKVRYLLAIVALFLCAAGPVTTYIALRPPNEPSVVGTRQVLERQMSAPISVHPVAPAQQAASAIGVRQRIEPFLAPLVLAWLIGLGLMTLRLLGGLILIERIKRKGRFDVDERWHASIRSLSQKLQLHRRVELRIADGVATPIVVGVLKAVILFPAAALIHLSTEEVEALLVHELAHIRRHDYVVNLVQSVLETVLFYHPGVWWISSVVRVEREHCCDDIALSIVGDRQKYAKALLGVEQLRQARPGLAVAATGGRLLLRVRRILLLPEQRLIPVTVWLTAVLIASVCLGVSQTLHGVPHHKNPEATTDVWGHVVDPGGHPVSGATVFWQDSMEPDEGFPVLRVSTDAQGAYRFVKVPDRPYGLIAIRAGIGFGVQSGFRDPKPEIRLRRSRPIHLRVVTETGKPVPGIRVGPETILMDRYAWSISPAVLDAIGAVTDANGRATLRDMPENSSIKFDVRDDRYVTLIPKSMSPVPYLSERSIVLGPACLVDGTVTQDGQPVPHVTVLAGFEPGNPSGIVSTDQSGHFELRRQPKGDLSLQCFLSSALSRDWIVRPIRVKTDAGHPRQVQFKLERGVHVTGKVVDMQGKPVQEATVQFSKDDSLRGVEAADLTKSDGSFKVAVAAGDHDVFVYRRGAQRTTRVTVTPSHSTPLTISLPSPSERDASTTFDCTVIDAGGRPAENVDVEFHYKNAQGREEFSMRSTDGDGKAKVEVSPEKAKTITFRAQQGNQFSDPTVAPYGNKAIIRLHRVALGSVSGIVRDTAGNPISGAKLEVSFMSRDRNAFLGDLTEVYPNGLSGLRSQADGSYRIAGLFPQTPVVITATAPGYADGQTGLYKVLKGRDLKLAPIRLVASRTVAGVFLTARGQPVSNANVRLKHLGTGRVFWAQTDRSGAYRFERIPQGGVAIRVLQGGKSEDVTPKSGRNPTYYLHL
jgi:beta-lactamase regulating signal transducer with metallopeptidase domain/uncharacterized GH25 family protein